MTDYPYIKTTAKLKEFLQGIPALGMPASVSTRWLPKIGFKSANHRPIIRIMEFIGFIKSNKPTERWRSYQAERNPRRVLAEGIAEGYSELFKEFPDADQRSDAELKIFFQKHLSVSDQAINSTIGTFKALCSLAEFRRANENKAKRQRKPRVVAKQPPPELKSTPTVIATSPASAPVPAPDYPTVHTDIQIHIHPDADADQIREIFKNMAKYLYNRDVD